MIRNIIFDWSGTLVDDLPAVLQATNHVFAKAGHERQFTMDEFRAEFCLPSRHFYDRFLPDVPIPSLEEWFHGRFIEVQHSVAALPHAQEFLEFVQAKKLRTLLLSTVRDDHYAIQAEVTKFGEFIHHPYTSVWDKCEKIHEILENHDLKPEETLFIGDMQHDIDTAKHAGVHSCGVLTGYNSLEQLRQSDPDVIVENLAELQRLLEINDLNFPFTNLVTEKLVPISTVGALIFDEMDRVLMIRTQKWSNLWGIPGGKIKYNEPSIDALRREIKEETALDVENIEFVMVQDCIQSQEFYRESHFLLLNYTCHTIGTCEVILNEEAQAFQWVTIDEALEMPLNQPTRKLINEVLNHRMQTK